MIKFGKKEKTERFRAGKSLLTIGFFIYFCILLPLDSYGNPKVMPGIDVLAEQNFSLLQGKKVALFTNQSGRSSNGRLSADIMLEAPEVDLIAILTPEHGLFGAEKAGETVLDGIYKGTPVFSLYGSYKFPSVKLLDLVDIIVIDIQDIGIRSYTFISSVFNLMSFSAQEGLPVIILDRPNPLGGLIIDGNILEPEMSSFVGKIRTTYIHGMTIAELAIMLNEEGWLGENKNGKSLKCELAVIEMKGWQRWMAWEDTGLYWFPTSPHIPTPDAVRGAAVLGAFGELSLFSIGIGTTSPFQYIGSPNFDVEEIRRHLLKYHFPGIILEEAKYKPFYGMNNGKLCSGFIMRFPLSNEFRPYTSGLKIVLSLRQSNPELFKRINISARAKQMFEKVTGTKDIYKALFSGKPDNEVIKAAENGMTEFIKLRTNYLLY